MLKTYKISEDSFLWKCVDSSNNTFPEFAYQELRNPSVAPTEQPKGFPDGFFMSPNQLRTLAWILSTERSTPRIKTYKNTICWRTICGNIFLDTKYKKLVSPSELPQYENTVATPKGGFLAGEDILGKKVEIVALILASLQHDNFSELKSVAPNKIYTHATLVVCPSREELDKWRSTFSDISKMRILTFESFDDLSSVTQQNIIDSDVVLVLLQFSKKFGSMKRPSKSPVAPPPTLEQFFWHRVILCDSNVYVQPQSIYLNMVITKLATAHTWCISSNPTMYSQVLSTTMQVLGFPHQCVHEFIHRFVWKTYQNPVSNSDTTFENEEIIVDLKPGVEFYSSLRSATLTSDLSLDDDKFRLITELQEKIIAKLETLRTKPSISTMGLAADIYFHEMLSKTPDIYKGPPMAEETFMSHLSDSNLAPLIREKNDINEREDVLRGECPKYNKYTVKNTKSNSPPRKSEEKEKVTTHAPKEKDKKKLFSIFSGKKKKETKSSEKEVKKEAKDTETDAQEEPGGKEGGEKKTEKEGKEDKETEKGEQRIEKEKRKEGSREIQKGMLDYLTNLYGSKKVALFVRLKEIWEKDPSARVLVCSAGPYGILNFLEKNGIAAGIITDLITVYRFAGERLPVWTSNPKNTAPLRVFLYDKVDSNMFFRSASFAVSHIFFLDVLVKNQEHRLVAAVHPQGDRKVVHIVRIFWQNSLEHETLLNYKDTTVPFKKFDIPKPTVDPDSKIAKNLLESGVPDGRIQTFVSYSKK